MKEQITIKGTIDYGDGLLGDIVIEGTIDTQKVTLANEHYPLNNFRTVNTQITKEDIENAKPLTRAAALDLSIEKWRRVVEIVTSPYFSTDDIKKLNISEETCALCHLYQKKTGTDCISCPLDQKCESTTAGRYGKVSLALSHFNTNPTTFFRKDLIKAARSFLHYLKGTRTKIEREEGHGF